MAPLLIVFERQLFCTKAVTNNGDLRSNEDSMCTRQVYLPCMKHWQGAAECRVVYLNDSQLGCCLLHWCCFAEGSRVYFPGLCAGKNFQISIICLLVMIECMK